MKSTDKDFTISCCSYDIIRCGKPVTCVSFCQKSSIIAYSTLEGDIVITSLSSKRTSKIKAHKSKITSLCLSENTRFLASSGLDGNIRIFDILADWRFPYRTIKCSNKIVNSLCFASNSSLLLVGNVAGDIVLYNPGTAKMISRYNLSRASINHVSFGFDINQVLIGNLSNLTIGTSNGDVVLFDVQKGVEIYFFKLKYGGITKASAYNNLDSSNGECNHFLFIYRYYILHREGNSRNQRYQDIKPTYDYLLFKYN